MVNLSKELEKLISENEQNGVTASLLLHCCCAPCSSSVLEYLTQHFLVTVLYYNPNISPKAEYEYRLAELKRLITEMNFKHQVQLLECEYNPAEFFDAVKGLEAEPEGGARCKVCFQLRLGETARLAAKYGFDYFTTTLSVSPLKNSAVLYETACEQAAKHGAQALKSDFKKKDGYKRSIELSRKHNLYRQNFCGCVFSKNDESR